MALDKRTRQRMLALCGEIHDDDGVDPRRFFNSDGKEHKSKHKLRQLCRQVARTLSLVLAGDGSDEILRGLYVVSVEPAPDASRLIVTVGTDENPDRERMLGRLAEHAVRLRCEVAAAITRRRAPTLVFDLVCRGSEPQGAR